MSDEDFLKDRGVGPVGERGDLPPFVVSHHRPQPFLYQGRQRIPEGFPMTTQPCPYCGFTADGTRSEIEHMRTAHPDVVAKRLEDAGLEVPAMLLPKVTIHRNSDNEQMAEFRGERARASAEDYLATLTNPEDYTFSESDWRCKHCGTEYWHEAAVSLGDDEYGCPKCEATTDDSERPPELHPCVGDTDDIRPHMKKLHDAMTGLANSDSFFTNPAEKFESAEEFYMAVSHVVEAAEKLSEVARTFLRNAEDELPEDYDHWNGVEAP